MTHLNDDSVDVVDIPAKLAARGAAALQQSRPREVRSTLRVPFSRTGPSTCMSMPDEPSKRIRLPPTILLISTLNFGSGLPSARAPALGPREAKDDPINSSVQVRPEQTGAGAVQRPPVGIAAANSVQRASTPRRRSSAGLWSVVVPVDLYPRLEFPPLPPSHPAAVSRAAVSRVSRATSMLCTWLVPS